MPVIEDSQVFNIIALVGEQAVLPVESVLYVLVVGIYIVKNSICVYLVTRREHYDLEMLVGFF